ncbi:unnamed protein product [Arctogadus glacialis]
MFPSEREAGNACSCLLGVKALSFLTEPGVRECSRPSALGTRAYVQTSPKPGGRSAQQMRLELAFSARSNTAADGECAHIIPYDITLSKMDGGRPALNRESQGGPHTVEFDSLLGEPFEEPLDGSRPADRFVTSSSDCWAKI